MDNKQGGIVGLISEIGNENIEFQLLSKSITRFKENKKHGDHEITFASSADKMNQNKQGIIIWCDKDKINDAYIMLKEK